ncbi:MAG: TetR/AcrR family transcriptional regulator [Solirubrobacteraceae bacterium]
MTPNPPRRRGRPPSGGREAILASTLALLRERGIARLTTREVAQRAGVSEASVFYHYTDRAGLLRAVFAAGLTPLQQLGEDGLTGSDHRDVLLRLSEAIERFLDQALPVMMAAQSDTELRDSMAAYLQDNGLGPQRGVEVVVAYLAAEQAAGRLDPAIDAEAVGLLVVGASFLRAAQRQIMAHTQDNALPGSDRAIELIVQLLTRPARRRKPR